MKITIRITEEEFNDLKPLLERSNRDVRNYINSLVKLAIRCKKSNTEFLSLEDIGKCSYGNPFKKTV